MTLKDKNSKIKKPDETLMKKIILAITGEISAGKGEMARYIEKKHKGLALTFSRPLRDVLDRLHLDQTRKNVQDISIALRQFFGENILSQTIVQDVKKSRKKLVAIDGMRRMADVKNLRKIGKLKIVYIEADPETRFKRLKKRGENVGDRSKSYKKFLSDHEKETEKTILALKKKSDFVIENNGTKKEFHKNIDRIIDKLKI